MTKAIFTTAAIIFLSVYAFAQTKETSDVLPIGFAPGEEQLMDSYLNSVMNSMERSGITTPPTLPVRTAAQWEESQALVITWTAFPAIHRQIIAAAQTECTVIIHCTDSNSVKSDLNSNSVPLTNLKFIEADFNSIWIRDYAANTCYLNDVDSLILVDWIYNRPRPDDDEIPVAYAALLDIPLYRTTNSPSNMMNTGGNWMVDGMGTAFASELILMENDGAGSYSLNYPNHSEAEINQIMSDYHGINRYIKMEVLPYDGIHHIDMHMKFLDEKTILIGEFPLNVSDGPQLEANLQYVLSNFNNPWGQPYKIIRIPMPPSTGGLYAPDASYRTYSNFVIVNKTIIMPTYRQQYDTTAVRIIAESMPGYKIVTIDSDNTGNNLVSQGGVIHCITHTVGVNQPLRIVHNSLEDTYDSVNAYQVDAIIQHKTGIANATLFWTTDTTQAYNAVSMALTDIPADSWSASIPAQPAGSKVFYYIHAEATDGKQQVRPITAPDGWWKFNVLGTVSINENLNNLFATSLFPNPSKGITCIPFSSTRNLNGKLYVTDMFGKNIQTIHTGEFKQGESKFFLNTSNWVSGVYAIIAETNEGKVVQRLIVK
ncbi:MAG: Peptidylarginine deiminase [Bacteroidia bacterium]|nr:Peptidylarginine deiminase [Bacteroidia bacterium]